MGREFENGDVYIKVFGFNFVGIFDVGKEILFRIIDYNWLYV